MKAALLSNALCQAKRAIAACIPPDFVWTFEMDYDVTKTIRVRWTGCPGNSVETKISDFDFGVLLLLLKSEDWEAHRRFAISAMDAAEAELLRKGQNQRAERLLLADAVPQGASARIGREERRRVGLAASEAGGGSDSTSSKRVGELVGGAAAVVIT